MQNAEALVLNRIFCEYRILLNLGVFALSDRWISLSLSLSRPCLSPNASCRPSRSNSALCCLRTRQGTQYSLEGEDEEIEDEEGGGKEGAGESGSQGSSE